MSHDTTPVSGPDSTDNLLRSLAEWKHLFAECAWEEADHDAVARCLAALGRWTAAAAVQQDETALWSLLEELRRIVPQLDADPRLARLAGGLQAIAEVARAARSRAQHAPRAS